MWSEEIKYLKMDSNVRVIGVKKNVYLKKTLTNKLIKTKNMTKTND